MIIEQTPYTQITKLAYNDHGWFREANEKMLRKFIENSDVNVVIEVGSWLGKSARLIASLLPSSGRIFCIDPWPESKETFPGLDTYHQFLSNAIHENLSSKIIPIRATSREATKYLEVKADLIYIDGSHEEVEVLHDIQHWLKNLNSDAILCGDDYGNSDYPGVKTAVDDMGRRLKKKVRHLDEFWWYENE